MTTSWRLQTRHCWTPLAPPILTRVFWVGRAFAPSQEASQGGAQTKEASHWGQRRQSEVFLFLRFLPSSPSSPSPFLPKPSWTNRESAPEWAAPTCGRRAGRFDAAGIRSRSRRNCRRKMNGTSAEDGVRQAPSMQPPPQLEWKFSQVFGERMAGEEVQEGAIFAPRYCNLRSLLFGGFLMYDCWSWSIEFIWKLQIYVLLLMDFTIRFWTTFGFKSFENVGKFKGFRWCIALAPD